MSGFFGEKGAGSSHIITDVTCASEGEPSSLDYSLAHEGTLLTAIDPVPHLPGTDIASEGVHVLPHAPYLCSNGIPLNDSELYVERTAQYPMDSVEVQIWGNQVVPYADRWSSYARNDILPSYHCWPEDAMRSLSPRILRDADELLSSFPNILNDLKGVPDNRNRTIQDTNRSNVVAIGESEITCQFGATCHARLKVKDIRSHLRDRHGVDSSTKPYKCRWRGCSLTHLMIRSSLERHVLERHGPSEEWLCSACGGTFTRIGTLKKHLKICSAHKKAQEKRQGEGSRQGFA